MQFVLTGSDAERENTGVPLQPKSSNGFTEAGLDGKM